QSFAASRVPKCSKHPAQRRTVDGSGDRDASATSGTDRSQLLSDWRNNSHACCRAVEAVDPCWRRPIEQHSECLLAWATKAPANPDLRMPFIVRLLEPPSVADDRPIAAERA